MLEKKRTKMKSARIEFATHPLVVMCHYPLLGSLQSHVTMTWLVDRPLLGMDLRGFEFPHDGPFFVSEKGSKGLDFPA